MRLSPDEGANGAVRTLTSNTARSVSSSLLLAQSIGPTTAQRTLVSPICTSALPFVPLEFVRGDICTVMRLISFGLRPSSLKLDRARRSVLLSELIGLTNKYLRLVEDGVTDLAMLPMAC